MKKPIQHTYFILLLLLLSCSPKQKEVTIDPALIDKNIAKDVEIIYSDSAQIALIIRGPEMHTIKDKYNNSIIEFPKGINITFFDKTGDEDGNLKANKGVQNQREGKITFYGDVEIIGKKKEELYTQELVWNQRINKVISKRLVKIISNQDTLEGIGIEAAQDLSEWFMVAPFGPMQIKQ